MLRVGTIFTGRYFQDKIEVLKVDEEKNILEVKLTKKIEGSSKFTIWTEEWDLMIVRFGFEEAIYFYPEKDKFIEYP